MKIAVLSGKGGTGKTFVSVNLAVTAQNAVYKDCDVEEPNGHLFLKPQDVETQTITRLLPVFDNELCNGCKKCVDFCKFNALALVKEKPMLFSDVCHSCGGCVGVCPQNAITEVPSNIGKIETGHHEYVSCVTGILDLGQASGVPVISAVLNKKTPCDDFTVIDCPPGSACTVMESIQDVDFCIIVGEPTAFGLHNFKMVYELTQVLSKPCGVVINKCGEKDDPLYNYCNENDINVLLKIPYSSKLGLLNADGNIVCEKDDDAKAMFELLLQKVRLEVAE